MSIEQARKEILETGKRLYEKGFISSNDGNISIKISDKKILTTPTGVSKGLLSRDDLVVVDLDGKVISGKSKPSSELAMHLYIYKTRKDVKAVLHAHPPYCTGFATAGISLDRCVLPEVILTLGAIPLAEYATPTTNEVAESLKDLVPNSNAILLANHGAVTLCDNLTDAYWKMERMEHAAKISYIARTLGGEQILKKTEVRKLEKVREEYGASGHTPECWSCGDCIGEDCVNHDYRDQQQSEDDLSKIVKKIMASIDR